MPVDHQNDPTPPGLFLGHDAPDVDLPQPARVVGAGHGRNAGHAGIWQYWVADAGSVPGITTRIDLDVFHSELGSISIFLVPEPGFATVACVATAALLGYRPSRQPSAARPDRRRFSLRT